MYFRKTKLLLIEFKSGAIYAYANVPWDIYLAFRHAKSKGAYHSRSIRDDFQYEQLSSTDVTRFQLK